MFVRERDHGLLRRLLGDESRLPTDYFGYVSLKRGTVRLRSTMR